MHFPGLLSHSFFSEMEAIHWVASGGGWPYLLKQVDRGQGCEAQMWPSTLSFPAPISMTRLIKGAVVLHTFSFNSIYLWAFRSRKENGSHKIVRPSYCEFSSRYHKQCNNSREELQRQVWENNEWASPPMQSALLVNRELLLSFGVPAKCNEWTWVAQLSRVPNNVVAQLSCIL